MCSFPTLMYKCVKLTASPNWIPLHITKKNPIILNMYESVDTEADTLLKFVRATQYYFWNTYDHF